MNCCTDRMINRLRVEINSFNILFTGHIKPARGLELLSNLVTKLKDIELIVCGSVKQKILLDKITGIPNIKYIGLLDPDRLLDLETSL